MPEILYRHLKTFPRPLTPDHQRRQRPFQQGIDDTFRRLKHELEKLGATRAYLELAASAADILKDGSRPKVNARLAHPGVVLVAETKEHGVLSWACDDCESWDDNARAIAITLERLRLADLYSVMRGAQYRGFAQLPAASTTDVDRGRELIRRHGGVTAALKATHPDHGGSAEAFHAVQVAREAGHV